ncbi:hypothetical protein [Kitasatospora aureofaciens]|uniref:hypothetical protein n=1 Tax=Kitasatospora aureofaciens TaxID=1894 RepID=UPI001D295785|nr:hypothetical protein [Kitasatospora aureofaciens]HJD84553.1 hypothetical protein [Kitasatospora aureofaciens]
MPSVYAEDPDGRRKVAEPVHERRFAKSVSLQQIRSCDPEAFHRAAEEWDKLGTALGSARFITVDVLSTLQEGWSGDAATLGRRALTDLVDEMSIAEQEMEAARLTLVNAATGLALARRWVAEADDLARANDLTINDDADIEYPAWLGKSNDPETEGESRRLATVAGDIRNLLTAAVKYAADVSSTAGHELDRIDGAVKYRHLDDWTKRVVGEDLAAARDLAKVFGGEGGVLLPPDPYDRGAGDYNTASPTDQDRKLAATLGAGIAAMPFAAGGTHASANMAHYLSGTGEPLNLNVEDMLKDIPDFQQSVNTTLDGNLSGWEAEALAEYRRTGKPVSLVQQTGWQPMSATPESSKDWFYAVGSFHYNTQAKIEVKPTSPGAPPEVTVTYQTNVRDRYNWDSGKSTDVPGVGRVTDKDIQRLHRTGLAREFDMGGASRTRTRKL